MLNSKDRLRLSRLLSQLERLRPDEPAPQFDGSRVGAAMRLGITGPLGAGKSSLIDQIIRRYRKQGLSVGVIAVDPSSPFTGGALLGDRVRMNEFTSDDGVFIRSLATRGMSGGLAATAIDAADIIDQAGFERIIIETVGVGQVEVDIAGACDIIALVLEPASGDIIQTMKAGLMEIADIFVVNKKDLSGADRFISELEMMLEMKHGILTAKADEIAHHRNLSSLSSKRNIPNVVATNARSGEGIDELCAKIEEWLKAARESGALTQRRLQQRGERIRKAAEEMLLKRFRRDLPAVEIERLAADSMPIREAARELVDRITNNKN